MANKNGSVAISEELKINPVTAERKATTISSAINIIVPVLLAFVMALIPILISKENPFMVYGAILNAPFVKGGFAAHFASHGSLITCWSCYYD